MGATNVANIISKQKAIRGNFPIFLGPLVWLFYLAGIRLFRSSM